MTGNRTKLEVEGTANPANRRLVMGGGVAGALLRTGETQIQNEALGKAPVPIGKAAATTAGKLKAKYVIQSPTMVLPAMSTNKENVKLATTAVLEYAS